jgi:PucR family transcriptional regulator, purine catabolism regulatory protein
MAVRVRDIMKLGLIERTASLVSGHEGIDNVINYVTILEAPDFYEWVSGGEFVITTWYAFQEHPEAQGHCFTELAKRGIAALGIKVNRFIKEIPQEIIAISNQYKVPVFSIRRETRFREIIQAIGAELNNYQTNILIEVEKNYQDLAKIALAGGDFDLLLKSLRNKRNCSCLCLSWDYELIGSSPFGSKKIPVEEVINKLKKYEMSNRLSQYKKIEDLHVFPCMAFKNTIGYLVFIAKQDFPEKHVLMANQLATLLTMKLLDRIDTEQKALASLLDDMLFKQELDEQELNARLNLLGLKIQSMFRVIIVNLKDSNTNTQQVLRHYGLGIRRIIGDALQVIKKDEIILIASCQKEDSMLNKPTWLKKLADYVADAKDKVTIGIGPSVASINAIKGSYAMAQHTLNSGLCLNKTGVLYYGESFPHTLLYRLSNTPDQSILINQVIKPIINFDEKYKANLLLTLSAVMFSDDLEKNAAQMHVHINTI